MTGGSAVCTVLTLQNLSVYSKGVLILNVVRKDKIFGYLQSSYMILIFIELCCELHLRV
jgi:hypothetical protein